MRSRATQHLAPRLSGVVMLLLALVVLGGCNYNAGTAAAESSVRPGTWPDARPASPHPAYKQSPMRCEPCKMRPHRAPIGEVYAGGSALFGDAIGGTLELGQVFARTNTADWSFEVEGGAQALDAELYGNTSGGSWAQAQGGVKASFLPLGRGHPTARAGLAWFRTTEPTELVEKEGDYFGLYAGIGYEWDITPNFTTGPELSVIGASKEGEWEPVVVPQFSWHFLYNF